MLFATLVLWIKEAPLGLCLPSPPSLTSIVQRGSEHGKQKQWSSQGYLPMSGKTARVHTTLRVQRSCPGYPVFQASLPEPKDADNEGIIKLLRQMVFLNLGKMRTLAPSLAFLSLATITWGSVLPRPKFSKLSLTKAETSTEAAIIEFYLTQRKQT